MAQVKLEMLQILNEHGNITDKKLLPKLTQQQMLKMNEFMLQSRVFDETALKLQREGRILTFAAGIGQEAATVGSAFALEKDDWMFPSFRENSAYMVRGMPPELLYQYWAGDERGNKIPETLNCFTVSVPVSTQIPHAVGTAWAMKLKKEKSVAMVYFGDGATSKGDFHEGMNFAGVFKVPCVFVCQNNQWAISFPRSRQTAAETLAQKAFAYGFDGVLVDGNDVLAVYAAAKNAVDKARKGEGPTFVECFTYRMADHTTADDAARYRSAEEIAEWKKKDPIDRFEKYLLAAGILTEKIRKETRERIRKRIADAVKSAESVPASNPEDIFNFTYAEMPWFLKEQMNELMQAIQQAKEVEVK